MWGDGEQEFQVGAIEVSHLILTLLLQEHSCDRILTTLTGIKLRILTRINKHLD